MTAMRLMMGLLIIGFDLEGENPPGANRRGFLTNQIPNQLRRGRDLDSNPAMPGPFQYHTPSTVRLQCVSQIFAVLERCFPLGRCSGLN